MAKCWQNLDSGSTKAASNDSRLSRRKRFYQKMKLALAFFADIFWWFSVFRHRQCDVMDPWWSWRTTMLIPMERFRPSESAQSLYEFYRLQQVDNLSRCWPATPVYLTTKFFMSFLCKTWKVFSPFIYLDLQQPNEKYEAAVILSLLAYEKWFSLKLWIWDRTRCLTMHKEDDWALKSPYG